MTLRCEALGFFKGQAVELLVAELVTGEVVDSVWESYKNDSDEFKPRRRYAARNNVFEELFILRELIFPCFWNTSLIRLCDDKHALAEKLRQLLLTFCRGISSYSDLDSTVLCILKKFLERLPGIRELVKKDVYAVDCGDPAANSYTEIIRTYPNLAASMIQRVAHGLWLEGCRGYARELTELIHEKHHIDIHPGTSIGEYFFIDHGTGVVIGETAVIGDWCRIYQGVTLGFYKQNSTFKKGYKRHPTIGNNVIIGAGVKILGPCVVGDHVSIGANCIVSEDVPEKVSVFITEFFQTVKHKRKVVCPDSGKQNWVNSPSVNRQLGKGITTSE